MSVKILFFGQLREQLNLAETHIDLDTPISILELKSKLVAKNASYEPLLQSNLLSALNQSIVNDDSLVSDSDELAFFPPVTGG